MQTDLTTGSATVYLGRTRSEFGGLSDDSDVAISYDRSCTFGPPQGRLVGVAGRPALLDSNQHSPWVCVAVPEDHVCVRTVTSDSSPRYATDLRDRPTWFAADRALS